MISVLVRLVVHSLLLLLLTSAVFWAVAGSACARRTGRSRAVGALVGALLPGVGAGLMLIPPRQALRQAQRGGRAQPRAVLMPLAQPASPPSPFAPLPPPPPPPPSRIPHGSIPLPPVGSPHGLVVAVTELNAGHLVRTATAALAALLLAGAALEPWFEVHAPVVSAAGVLDQQLSLTAIPTLIGAVAVVAAAVGHVLRPRGIWAVVAAAVGATALLVSLQLLLVTDAIGELLRQLAGSRIPAGSGVHPAVGALLLLCGGLVAILWAATSMAACPPCDALPDSA